MRTTETFTTILSKQRLRNELSSHIEDFLHKGGRIEVLGEPTRFSGVTRLDRWPAAAESSNPLYSDAD